MILITIFLFIHTCNALSVQRFSTLDNKLATKYSAHYPSKSHRCFSRAYTCTKLSNHICAQPEILSAHQVSTSGRIRAGSDRLFRLGVSFFTLLECDAPQYQELPVALMTSPCRSYLSNSILNKPLQRFISDLVRFRFLPHNINDALRTNKDAVASLMKTVRSSILSFLVSVCLLFSISPGFVGACQGLASQPRTASRKSAPATATSEVKPSERKKQEIVSNARTHHSISKGMSKVEVELIIAQADVVKTPSAAKEGKTVRLAKEINRKSKQVEKSLSKDLFEFEKEAEEEVKQSWKSLTGSMKGMIRTTYLIGGIPLKINCFPIFFCYKIRLLCPCSHTLQTSLHRAGAKLDTLIMLIVTSAVIPIFKRLNLSPILGFLLMGTVLGQSSLVSLLSSFLFLSCYCTFNPFAKAIFCNH